MRRAFTKKSGLCHATGLRALHENARASPLADRIEQAIALDQLELGRRAIDPHRSAGVVEADRLRALDRADPPELLGRRPALGSERDPLAGSQPLAEIDGP